MVWVAGSSRAGYDYPGTYEQIEVVQVYRPGGILGMSSMPGSAACPLVPCDRVEEIDVIVEVES